MEKRKWFFKVLFLLSQMLSQRSARIFDNYISSIFQSRSGKYEIFYKEEVLEEFSS